MIPSVSDSLNRKIKSLITTNIGDIQYCSSKLNKDNLRLKRNTVEQIVKYEVFA